MVVLFLSHPFAVQVLSLLSCSTSWVSQILGPQDKGFGESVSRSLWTLLVWGSVHSFQCHVPSWTSSVLSCPCGSSVVKEPRAVLGKRGSLLHFSSGALWSLSSCISLPGDIFCLFSYILAPWKCVISLKGVWRQLCEPFRWFLLWFCSSSSSHSCDCISVFVDSVTIIGSLIQFSGENALREPTEGTEGWWPLCPACICPMCTCFKNGCFLWQFTRWVHDRNWRSLYYISLDVLDIATRMALLNIFGYNSFFEKHLLLSCLKTLSVNTDTFSPVTCCSVFLSCLSLPHLKGPVCSQAPFLCWVRPLSICFLCSLLQSVL